MRQYNNRKREIFRKKLTNADFQYTSNQERVIWTKEMYAIMPKLINAVMDIDWDGFKYTGNSHIVRRIWSSKDNMATEISYDKPTEYNSGIKYHFFGGSCYELLNYSFPEVTLSEFMDPTGDIDVRVVLPALMDEYTEDIDFTFSEIETEFQKKSSPAKFTPHFEEKTGPKMLVNGKLNPFYDAALEYMFNQLAGSLRNHDIESIPLKNTVDFDIKEYDGIDDTFRSPSMGFRQCKFGNLHLVAFIDTTIEKMDESGSLRVQLVGKVVDNGVEIVDHILELVGPYNNQYLTTNREIKQSEKDIMTLFVPKFERQVRIQKYSALIDGTLNAYLTRVDEVRLDSKYIHKGINHIGRLLYIYELLSHYLVKNDQTGNNILSLLDERKKSPAYLSDIIGSTEYKLKEYFKLHNTFTFKYFKINPTTKNISVVDLPFYDIFVAYAPLFIGLHITDPYSTFLQFVSTLFQGKNKEMYAKYYLFRPKSIPENILSDSETERGKIMRLVKTNTAYTRLKPITKNSIRSARLVSTTMRPRHRSVRRLKPTTRRSRPVSPKSRKSRNSRN
jgi:hypothetical protein